MRCARTDQVAETKTDAKGYWEMNMGDKALPCAIRISGGNLPDGVAYHSVALGGDIANITTLTDLQVAGMIGQTPSSWWGGNGPSTLDKLTQERAATSHKALLTGLGIEALKSINPITTVFDIKSGDSTAKILKALHEALAKWKSSGTGFTYQSLVSSAASGGGLQLSEQQRQDLSTSYSKPSTPDASVPEYEGKARLQISLQPSGSSYRVESQNLKDMPIPITSKTFCGQVQDASSPLYVGKMLPKGWAFESCGYRRSEKWQLGEVIAKIPDASMYSGYAFVVVSYAYN